MHQMETLSLLQQYILKLIGQNIRDHLVVGQYSIFFLIVNVITYWFQIWPNSEICLLKTNNIHYCIHYCLKKCFGYNKFFSSCNNSLGGSTSKCKTKHRHSVKFQIEMNLALINKQMLITMKMDFHKITSIINMIM